MGMIYYLLGPEETEPASVLPDSLFVEFGSNEPGPNPLKGMDEPELVGHKG